MTSPGEYVIDGDRIGRLLESYQLESSMLPGQVFKIVEEKMVKSLADEIEKAKPHAVRFLNLEAICLGPYKDFLYAVCGGLAELADTLNDKKIAITGTVSDPGALPWNLVSRIDKKFKGIETYRDAVRPRSNTLRCE